MAKITELSDGGSLQSTDYLIAVRSGGNVKVQADGNLSLGTVTALGLTVDGTATIDGGASANTVLTLDSSTANTYLKITDLNSTNGTFIGATTNDLNFYPNNVLSATFAAGGDISFYEDTGTTAKLFWDASAESLGIGTTSPAELLHIESGTNGEQVDIRFRGLTTSAGAGRSANIGFDPDPNDTGTSSEAQLYLSADTTNKTLVATASGNVGIGTASPDTMLHLSSATNSQVLRFERTDTTVVADNPIGTIEFEHQDATDAGVAAKIEAAAEDASGSVGLRFETGTPTSITERMRIDSGGNVGIGTTSPLADLHLSSTSNTNIMISDSDAGTDAKNWDIRVDGNNFTLNNINDGNNASNTWLTAVRSGYTTDYISFHTGSGDERMRIDSSGSLLVGTTDTTPWDNSTATSADDGIFLGGGRLGLAKWGGVPLLVNRTDSDGEIAIFYKDGSAVGSIASTDGTDLQIGSGNCYLRFDDADNKILPTNAAGAKRDNVLDLGHTDARFGDIYASNGTIQTSDRNEKQDIEALSDAEQRVAVACKGLLRKWRWKSSVEENGDDARIHFGIIAQDLQAAFEAEGLDAGRYAMFINSTWTDEETGEERSRMGVRYSELLAFIIAAI
jgi:hypothetical protein